MSKLKKLPEFKTEALYQDDFTPIAGTTLMALLRVQCKRLATSLFRLTPASAASTAK